MGSEKRYVRFAAAIIVGTAGIFLLLSFAGFSGIMEALVEARKDYFLLALLTVVLVLLVRNVRWSIYLHKVGYRPKFSTSFFILLAGCFFENATPARIGEFFRPVILRFKENVSVRLTLPTVLVERTLDLGVSFVFALFGIVIMLAQLDPVIRYTIIIGMLVMLVLMVLVLHLPRIFAYIVRLGVRGLKVMGKGGDRSLEDELVEASGAAGESVFSLLRSKETTFYGIISTFIIWLLNGLRLYLVLKSLGLEISPLYATIVTVFTVLVATASMIPFGQGSAEFAMSLVLTSLGYPFELSVVAAVFDKFLAVWLVALIGAVAGSRLGYSKMFSKNEKDSRDPTRG